MDGQCRVRTVSGAVLAAPMRIAACLVLALFLPAIVEAAEDGPPRLLGVHYLGDLPTLVADERGYFRGAARDLNVSYTSSGRENLERLRAGEADFALMALTPLVIDALRDPSPGEPDDPVILGNLVHSHRINQVVSLENGSVSGPADLDGRRVGLMKGTNAEFFWSVFAGVHGLDPGQVELVDLSVDELPGALTGERIDAAVLWEPWISRTKSASEHDLRVLPGGSAYTAHWVLVGRRAFVNEHPRLTRDLLESYVRAIDWIDNHRERALALCARHLEVPEQKLEQSWTLFDYDLDLDWTVLNGLNLQLQWAADAGYGQSNGERPGVLYFVEPEPLRRVDAFRVSIPRSADDTRERQP